MGTDQEDGNMRHVIRRIATLALLLAAGAAMGQDILLRTSFEDGAKNWTGQNQAFVSDLSRRPGSRSLVIKQWADEEQDSHWLSPAIKTPGGPVTISFWAADNYQKQRDFSYAAVIDVVSYDAEGKNVGESAYLRSIPWDEARKEHMWGQYLDEGLVWRYYEVVHAPKGETFRVKFYWRKPITLGECYLTDLLITSGAPAKPAAPAAVVSAARAAVSRFALKVSTPADGNLFYPDDPLRFEILLHTTDDVEIGEIKSPVVRYEITDYERLFVARGEVPFDRAKPIADPQFQSKQFTKDKAHNLHQPLTVDDPAARAVGRELFFRAELLSDGTVLAHDTAPFVVLDPFRPDPADYEKGRFASSKFHHTFRYTDSPHADQSVAHKTGISWSQVYDYHWNKVQPVYPGPYNFGEKKPAFPRITFCPNLEQIRGRRDDHPWGSCATMCPEGAKIPDPLRPGHTTFEIDPYVDYMVAYIRHHRDAVARVVPSGLERPIDARTLLLHRKAYKAIKAEWPDLPVGIMLYGLPMNPSEDVDIFIDNELYKCTDFIDTHVYASSVDWTEWKRLQRFYRKTLMREPPPLLSTEFCRVGGMDQVQRSRDVVAAHLDAFAHGMFSLYYFNVVNASSPMERPFLRGPTDMGGDQSSGFLYMQWVQRLVTSAAVEPLSPHVVRSRWDTYGCSHHPLLITATYANLVRNFETADFRETFRPGPHGIGYVFDRGDRTTCAMWLRNPVPAETFIVRGETPFVLHDLFGRTERITPVQGIALVSLDENPTTLVFDRRVDDIPAAVERIPPPAGLTLRPAARGGRGTTRMAFPVAFSSAFAATVTGGVDETWPGAQEQTVNIRPGESVVAELPVAVPLEKAVGAYPFFVRLSSEGRVFGLLRTAMRVEELLKLTVTGSPVGGGADPAIEVVVESLRDDPSEGFVRLVTPFFADGLRAVPVKHSFSVGPRGRAVVRFPVDQAQINLSTSYEVTADVRDASGVSLSRTAEIAFRSTPRAPAGIVIDGELGDWELASRPALPFSREFSGWGKKRSGPDDLSGVYYTAWDETNLYFAVAVSDDSNVVRFDDVSIWQDDNIMLGLYPWGWRMGETLNSGYYREHLGMCKDGTARIFRVGNVAAGPVTAEGARVAVKRTGTRTVYEWRYPAAAVAPLALAPGSRFRLSLFALDRDETGEEDGKPTYSQLGGIQVGGFNENIDARPVRWREFVLVD